jgi:hypothetical protein
MPGCFQRFFFSEASAAPLTWFVLQGYEIRVEDVEADEQRHLVS